MTGLDPSSSIDRRITAFARRATIEHFPNGDALVVAEEFDCWGDLKNRVEYRERPDPTNLPMGQTSYLTLELMQAGCCPPQLTKDFIEREGELVERDPVEEAMKLHERGYFGGGG